MKPIFTLITMFFITGCDNGQVNINASSKNTCASKPTVVKGTGLIAALPTDSGMHALWDSSSFLQICDYDSWEKELLDNSDLVRHIRGGRFVPIYVHTDGTPVIELRVGSDIKLAGISEQEKKFVVAKSRPYLFMSHGNVTVSGIEYISGSFDKYNVSKTLELAQGRWTVTVFNLESEEKYRASDDLFSPDFLVILNPEQETIVYRNSVETFDKSIW